MINSILNKEMLFVVFVISSSFVLFVVVFTSGPSNLFTFILTHIISSFLVVLS